MAAEPLSCGITMRLGISAFTVAASDERAAQLDETQYEAGDGPCLTALRSGQIMHCADLHQESVGPTYVGQAPGSSG